MLRNKRIVNYNEDSNSSPISHTKSNDIVNVEKSDTEEGEKQIIHMRKYKTVSKKGNWTKEEDEKINDLVKQHGEKEWKLISQYLDGRTAKQCRERWVNQLHPKISKTEWSTEENIIIFILHKQFGNKWSMISKKLPNRTDNSIKNHWNNFLKHRKLHIKKIIKVKYAEYGISVDNNPMKDTQLVSLINWSLTNDAITNAKGPLLSLPESGSSIGLKLNIQKVESPPRVIDISSKNLESTMLKTASHTKSASLKYSLNVFYYI